MAKKVQKKICDLCGGSGQLSFFKGVSRFLLSVEECGECAGTGYQLESDDNSTKESRKGNFSGKKRVGEKKKK